MKSTRTSQFSHKKQHTVSDASGSLKALLSNIARGFVAECAIGILLLLLSAFCAYNYYDPAGLMPPLAMLSLYVAVASGGAITYKLNKNGAVLCGLSAAALQLCVMLCISQFVEGYPEPLYSDGWRIILHLLCFPVGLLGAYAASRPRKVRRKKRR